MEESNKPKNILIVGHVSDIGLTVAALAASKEHDASEYLVLTIDEFRENYPDEANTPFTDASRHKLEIIPDTYFPVPELYIPEVEYLSPETTKPFYEKFYDRKRKKKKYYN